MSQRYWPQPVQREQQPELRQADLPARDFQSLKRDPDQRPRQQLEGGDIRPLPGPLVSA